MIGNNQRRLQKITNILVKSEKVTNKKLTPHACLLQYQLGKLCHPDQQHTAVNKLELYQIQLLYA